MRGTAKGQTRGREDFRMFCFSSRLLACIALLSAVSAPAQDAAVPVPSPEQAAPDPASDKPPIVVEGKKEKKICDTVTTTGSIVPKRICRTKAEIEAAQAEAQEFKERLISDQETRRFVSATRDNK